MKAELTLAELEAIRDALAPFADENHDAHEAHAVVQAYIAKLNFAQRNEQNQWSAWAPAFGLKAEHLGKRFIYRRAQYEIVGINPSARRFPIKATRLPDGRPFMFPADTVKAALP